MGEPDDPDESALARLPTVYAVALRLDAAGADAEVIASALGIDVAAVGAVLDVGRGKLDELRRRWSDEPERPDRPGAGP
jgi:hypothetical protein